MRPNRFSIASRGDLARILQAAKRTSLAFLYWLQHDLGHPELKLRPDVMDTADGFSKYPYIRESRRMIARGRVIEQDIVEEYQPGPRARWFDDSIGTGFYMVDIHPCGANERGRMMMPRPFQIPMAALLPQEAVNFLPAGKNIGVTHLTNGAFRLHPIEWMVGEAAGTIAALAIARGALPPAADGPGGPGARGSSAGLVRRSAGRSSRFRRDPSGRDARRCTRWARTSTRRRMRRSLAPKRQWRSPHFGRASRRFATRDRAGLDGDRPPQLVSSATCRCCGAICAKTACRAGFRPGPPTRPRKALRLGAPSLSGVVNADRRNWGLLDYRSRTKMALFSVPRHSRFIVMRFLNERA